jgi:hypothetical protein
MKCRREVGEIRERNIASRKEETIAEPDQTGLEACEETGILKTLGFSCRDVNLFVSVTVYTLRKIFPVNISEPAVH